MVTEAEEEAPVALPEPTIRTLRGIQSLHINIQLQLPVTTEAGIYEALFSAMRKYILETSEEQ